VIASRIYVLDQIRPDQS